MIFGRLRSLHKNQRGFTLIELMIATAIAGLITGGIIMTTFGVISGNARSSNHMLAVRQVQNAGYWFSRDAQMAQSVTPDAGATGFPLTLSWTDWETGDVHQVVYELLSPDNKLQREHYTNLFLDPTTFVAEFIDPDPAKTSCVWDGSVLTLTVTATVGAGGPQEASETRTYEVVPRPDL